MDTPADKERRILIGNRLPVGDKVKLEDGCIVTVTKLHRGYIIGHTEDGTPGLLSACEFYETV